MWGQIISAIVGFVAGGTYNAVATSLATDEKVKAYKQATKEVRDAANLYSGQNAYKQMLSEGQDMAGDMARLEGSELAAERLSNNNPGTTGAGAVASAVPAAQTSSAKTNQAFSSGLSQGMSNAAQSMGSKYNAATTRANQLMKQADIDYNVAQQRNKELMGAVGDTVNTANQIVRKE